MIGLDTGSNTIKDLLPLVAPGKSLLELASFVITVISVMQQALSENELGKTNIHL